MRYGGFLWIMGIVLAVSTAQAQTVWIDFEDLALAPQSYYHGQPGLASWTSGGAVLSNNHTDFGGGLTYWDGWSYSNVYDTVTIGYGNQYAAFAGGGAGGAGNYAVAFDPSFNLDPAGYGDPPTIWLPEGAQPVSLMLTNTTYAALAMRDGDAFAKKFGGATGNDPDWFRVTIRGKSLDNVTINSMDVYLADYRFADNALDYIVDQWVLVDLAPLAGSSVLEFGVSSSDMDPLFGLNTPAYFAMDNLVVAYSAVPEPGSLVLCGLAAAGGGWWAGRRRGVTGRNDRNSRGAGSR